MPIAFTPSKVGRVRHRVSFHALQDSGVAAGDDAMKALGAKFGKLHGASSMANLGALCAGVGHVVWMASKLAF